MMIRLSRPPLSLPLRKGETPLSSPLTKGGVSVGFIIPYLRAFLSHARRKNQERTPLDGSPDAIRFARIDWTR